MVAFFNFVGEKVLKRYKSISCDFYDRLEIWAMRGDIVNVVYRDEEGRSLRISGRIQTILADKGAEFLIMEQGLRIRLDYLISVNDTGSGEYC